MNVNWKNKKNIPKNTLIWASLFSSTNCAYLNTIQLLHGNSIFFSNNIVKVNTLKQAKLNSVCYLIFNNILHFFNILEVFISFSQILMLKSYIPFKTTNYSSNKVLFNIQLLLKS